jgi:signal transduction histidine kinase
MVHPSYAAAELQRRQFAGIAVAAVEPLYFEKFYREVWVGSGAISLFLGDGTLLARAPQLDNAIGHSFASTDLFQNQLPHGDTGVSWSASPLDNIRRLAAYRRVDDNLVMLVAMNEDDVMHPWRDHALFSLGGAAVLMAVIGAMEFLLARFRQREARAKALLDRAQRLEATGRFAAGIAHDFGNVVRVVRSSVTLLRPMLAGNQEAENILVATSQAVETSRAMIDQLLLFSGNRDLSQSR